MSSTTISLIVLACVFGGALLGIFLHAVLPQHHLAADSKDIVKLGMGLVGTMAALVLGLLVASAKGSYDAQGAELTQMSANIAVLDRALFRAALMGLGVLLFVFTIIINVLARGIVERSARRKRGA